MTIDETIKITRKLEPVLDDLCDKYAKSMDYNPIVKQAYDAVDEAFPDDKYQNNGWKTYFDQI